MKADGGWGGFEKRTEKRDALSDALDDKFGFRRITEGPPRLGWLINMHPVRTGIVMSYALVSASHAVFGRFRTRSPTARAESPRAVSISTFCSKYVPRTTERYRNQLGLTKQASGIYCVTLGRRYLQGHQDHVPVLLHLGHGTRAHHIEWTRQLTLTHANSMASRMGTSQRSKHSSAAASTSTFMPSHRSTRRTSISRTISLADARPTCASSSRPCRRCCMCAASWRPKVHSCIRERNAGAMPA